jgi:hypothetical protein
VTYLGTPAGELSLDQLRYHGLLPSRNGTTDISRQTGRDNAMRNKRPGIIAAIEDNTRARKELTERLRPIDYNGHVPDQEAPDAAGIDEQLAATHESFMRAQEDLMSNLVQIAFELGRLRGRLEAAGHDA